MFSALATDMPNMYASQLRLDLADFLENTDCLGRSDSQWQDFSVSEAGGSREQYLRRMRRDGTWGDMITLQAFSEKYNVQIIVLSDHNPAAAFTPDGQNTNIDLNRPLVILGHYVAQHYVLLNKREEECLKAALDALKHVR